MLPSTATAAEYSAAMVMFHSLTWTEGHELLVTWSDRTQREVMIQSCSIKDSPGDCRDDIVKSDKLTTTGWTPRLVGSVM